MGRLLLLSLLLLAEAGCHRHRRRHALRRALDAGSRVDVSAVAPDAGPPPSSIPMPPSTDILCLTDAECPDGFTSWERAPGVRPDYYIERIGRDEVRDGDTLIWQEPGYVLDAKYYKPRDSARAPASPVKRMIADLALTGERHGAH